MTVHLGPKGMMAAFKCPSGLVSGSEPASSYRTTMEGVRKEQRGPRGRREWSVDIGTATPNEVAGLRALDLGAFGPPPWVWVDPWAQVTNLLSPESSVLESGTYSASATAGGLRVAADDVVAPRTVLIAAAGDAFFGSRDGAAEGYPVVAGIPVTASVYAAGDTAAVRVIFRDASGTYVQTDTSGTADVSFGRISVTATPPEGAVDCLIQVLAGALSAQVGNPAITWTPELVEWTPGNGCNRVTVEGLSEAVQLAASTGSGMRRSSMGFTVRELG